MAPSQINDPPTSPVPTKHSQSRFSSLPVPPPDEPFTLIADYLHDSHPQKVNLGIGVYRTEEGDPWPLPVVEEAEDQLHAAKNVARHEYLTIQGDQQFLTHARDLVFGFDSPGASTANPEDKDRIVSIQTVSGTGANRLGAEFLSRSLRPGCVWIPDPTWANHLTIWDLVGVPRKSYPYYDFARNAFNFDATIKTLASHAQPGDVIILHACAHNPTGADPTKDQWASLASLISQKGMVPFFDLAYQGFASGSLDEDAFAIRHFLAAGPKRMEFAVAQSFSKNFGLYGQRAGALHLVTAGGEGDGKTPQVVLANLAHLVRGEYSMAPRGGSEIVRTVLGSKELREKWGQDLQVMSGRIKTMRSALYDELVKLDTPGKWEHILHQVCLASLLSALSLLDYRTKLILMIYLDRHVHIHRPIRTTSPLDPSPPSHLHAEIGPDLYVRMYVSFLPFPLLPSPSQDHRTNVYSEVNTKNVRYVARAIDDVVRN